MAGRPFSGDNDATLAWLRQNRASGDPYAIGALASTPAEAERSMQMFARMSSAIHGDGLDGIINQALAAGGYRPGGGRERSRSPVHRDANFSAALAQYNASHDIKFEERDVRSSHRKPCDECSADFNLLTEYFVGKNHRGFGEEKLCLDCMQSRLTPFLRASSGAAGSITTNAAAGGASTHAVKDSERSSAGWRSWPIVRSGNYGLVYVVPQAKFGYYDDDEDEDECIIYIGKPMVGPAYMFKRRELRQPPFEGEHRAF